MKLVVLTAFIAVCGAAKLDRGYLPPASARTAGGNAEDLQTPIGHQGQGTLPKGGFTNEYQGVVVDAVAAGTRSSDPNDSGLGAPRPTYGSQDSKVGSAAFRLANQDSGNQVQQHGQLVRGSADAFRTNPFGTPSFPNSNSHASATSFSDHGNNFANQPNGGFGTGNERTQAAQERSASTLRFESEVGPESFNYAFETDSGISAEESAVATNGVQAQGAFSYTGDDGQVYSVTYTADEGGYQPKGDHLPTPPPIPEEILKSLEQNAKDEAAGLVDDGSYDARKYNEGADYTESSGDNGQYQHGTAEQQGNNSPFSSATAFSRQSSGHGSQTYASANSGQYFNAGSRQNGQNSGENFSQIQGNYNSNKPESLGRQPITHNGRNNQYNNHEFNVNQGQQNSQGSQEINRQSFDQSKRGNIQATSFSEQGKNGDRAALSHSFFGQSNVNQNSGSRTQADSFTSQGQSVNNPAFGQALIGQANNDNINNNGQGKETPQHQSTSHEFNRQYSGQNFGGTNQANTFAIHGQNGNRQAFSQASFGQTNSYDSTGAPSTDSGIIKNKFDSQQLIQQNRFGQNQQFENSIHNGNRHQYLPPVSQNRHSNSQLGFSQTTSSIQPNSQYQKFNTHNDQTQFNNDISEQQLSINTQHLESEQTVNNLQFGGSSAKSQANENRGISNQQNKYSTSHTEVPKFGQTTSPSGVKNNFAESTATFGIKKLTNERTDTHLSSDSTNFSDQSKLNKGSAEFNTHGSNSQIPIPTNHQSSAFGSASFGAQQISGDLNSRFNTPSTASPINYQTSSAYNQQTNKFDSPSDIPQTIKNSAQGSSQFGIHPANNAHGSIQQKYSTNTQFNSQQKIGQFDQKQFNVNDQSNNAFISSTEKPLNPSSSISQASFTTQKESYHYNQPPKNFNSPINTQFDGPLNIDKQNEFNSQSQFGTTTTFQAFPTQQSLINRFSSSNTKISGEQSKFPQQFNSQGPFFQAQPQSVAQASAQYQSNRQTQGFQKQTTAIPQQFQPLRQPFAQTQQATASAQFNKAPSQISPSIGSPNPSGTSGTTIATQQYNGEIYEYNKPAQSLPAPNQKDQDGSSTQVSSQSSFGSANQSFRGTQSQLTGSSVSGKGEIFGGPRKPPSFDEHSGYHY